MYLRIVGEKIDMHYGDAFRTQKFLYVLKELNLIHNSRVTQRRYENDNEICYSITIEEKINVD